MAVDLVHDQQGEQSATGGLLPADEVLRRIRGARILRGLHQQQLDELGFRMGLNRRELSRTERGELPLTKVRRHALASVLGLPEGFFTVPDISVLLRFPEELDGSEEGGEQ